MLATLATQFLLLPADMQTAGHAHQFLDLVAPAASLPCTFRPSPHVLGIDDFAPKKGDCYGTILVDLERHRPIDLLPDREAATVMAWLKAHPEIDLVSRDRASVYGQAVKKGAPQAIQVADRYHLLVNLRDHLKSLLDHKRTSLPKVEVERPDGQVEDQQESPDAQREALAALMKPLLAKQEPEPARDASLTSFVRDTTREKWFYTPSRPALARSQASRTRRFARFEEVRALHQQGLSMRTIARELGISRARVSTFIQAETFPEQAPRTGGRADYAAQAAQTSHVRQSQVRFAPSTSAPSRLIRACLHHTQR
jgi:transposase